MSSQDCKVIEKGLKDIIFSMSSNGNIPSQDSDRDSKLDTSSFAIDEKFSNPDKNDVFRQNNLKDHFEIPSPANLLINETNSCSTLIDIDALTEFTAKHIDNSTSFKEVQLPHPDLEDDSPAISNNTDVSALFEKIQNSPNFSNLPENPLQQSNYKNSKRQSRDRNAQRQTSPLPRKRSSSKKKKKKKKTIKQKDSLDSEVSQSLNGPKTSVKVLEKETERKEEESFIKTKKKVFSSIGREYSLHMEKDGYRFQCHICYWATDRKESVAKHLSNKTHQKHKELSDKDMMLPFLPEPLPSQIEAISELLCKEGSRKGLNQKDIDERKLLSQKFTKFVQGNVPWCEVQLVGSSAYGIGLKQSEVDFIVQVAEFDLVPDALEALYEAVSKDNAYDKAVADFKQKRPQVRFIDKETKLFCNILIDNSSSFRLANIISAYCKLDERVQILGAALRCWAKLCDVDLQDRGTLPPFSFALLLIHFLQQVQPCVLPVLHEVKNFNSSPEFYDKYVKDKVWKSENTDTVGLLWIKFFRYYTYEFKIGEDIVSIRSSKRNICSERKWNTKFYAIEEPFLKRNIAYVIPTFQVCQYIQNCFLRTYRYFAYPQAAKDENVIQLIKTDDFDALTLYQYVKEPVIKGELSDESEISDNEDSAATDPLNISQDLEDHDPELAVEDLISVVSNITLDDEITENIDKNAEDATHMSDMACNELESIVQGGKQKENSNKSSSKLNATPICIWDTKGKKILKEEFCYKFDSLLLKGDKKVPFICRLCKKSGHLKKDCPVEEIPPPLPLPSMTQEYLEAINRVLLYIWEKNKVNETDLKKIESDMKDIESSVKEEFPDAKLSLFGSFCNGFGFRNNSDMDFCLTFTGKDDGKNLDSTKIIEKVAAQLSNHPRLENIVSITSAKVPIVKFAWKNSLIEGDISLYNTLALKNTQMLDLYSKIDKRVQILGYGFKYFAKALGICDASKGSLSSYAYILMVIFFLQQRNPPVIPVLQELYEGKKPVELVDGWNVWFFKDIQKLKDVWPDFGKNQETVAQLWVALLCFYACDFNWKEYVISIKQKGLLRRFKKLWISEEFAIEDPFDLNHNLGGGLSRKMNVYILKTFIRGRERFGMPLATEKMCTIFNREEPYFFQRNFLTSGREPPHDRGCANCGKIGHKKKDCPQEKTCTYCRKPGHSLRNCPKKRGQPKKQDQKNIKKGNRFNFDSPNNNERKGSVEKIQNQRIPQHMMMKNDALLRTYPGMQLQNPQHLDSQKLLKMGVPIHRMPPPGFPGRTPANPPPGFTNNAPMLQKPVNYSSPFPHVPPFPRQGNQREGLSQSPPKPYSSSPPKNYQPNKGYHKSQEKVGWGINPRNSGFQVERHPNPQHMQGHSRGPWINRPMMPHSVQHKSNQHQTMDHRHRTNSDHHSYNSNSDKWFSQ